MALNNFVKYSYFSGRKGDFNAKTFKKVQLCDTIYIRGVFFRFHPSTKDNFQSRCRDCERK